MKKLLILSFALAAGLVGCQKKEIDKGLVPENQTLTASIRQCGTMSVLEQNLLKAMNLANSYGV